MAMRRQTALAKAAAGTGSMLELVRRPAASESRTAVVVAETGSMMESGRKSAALGNCQVAAAAGLAMVKRGWAAAAAGLVTAMSAHLPSKQDEFVAVAVPLRCCSSIL
jgi:hypothetical protein